MLETALKLANRENTEVLTSRLISLGKPGKQTGDDRDGFHKLQFDKKNKNKRNKLMCISDFLYIEYKGRDLFLNILVFFFCYAVCSDCC